MFTFYQMLQGLRLFQKLRLFRSLSVDMTTLDVFYRLMFIFTWHVKLWNFWYLVHIMALKSNKTATFNFYICTDFAHILKEFGEELQNFKITIMPSGFFGRRWWMLSFFFFLFRFAHDKDALLDLETIDDDLDQEGKSIYSLLIFFVKFVTLFTLCYLVLPGLTFCYLLLPFVTLCYLLLPLVTFY